MKYKNEMILIVSSAFAIAAVIIFLSLTRPAPNVSAAIATPQVWDCVVLEQLENGIRLSCTLLEEETPTETPTETPVPTDTETPVPTDTPTVTNTPSAPFASAPLCAEHDNSVWHSPWNSTGACHYDHEHGTNPFTPQVAGAFPGFDLRALLGNVEISHTNPSSEMENTMKHGGHKWQVATAAPQGCNVGFESGTVAVDAYAIQFHAFGRQDVEFESRNHSTAAMLRQCKAANPSDKGYVYVTQLQEYGERVMPYQGAVLPYPDNFLPTYDGSFGPYFTTECFGMDTIIGGKFIDCRPSSSDTNNNLTIWTSKRTGPVSQPRPPVSSIFRLLFRGRDEYQRFDITDLTHPFTWRFVCGGVSYNPNNCRFNNSSLTVHEIAGDIPTAWDGLAGFDTDPRVGRVTATGFVTGLGALNPSCTVAGGNCYPLKLVGAFVGRYSSELSVSKVSNPNPDNTPERDIYFCSGVVCSETSPGAMPSGWIGAQN